MEGVDIGVTARIAASRSGPLGAGPEASARWARLYAILGAPLCLLPLAAVWLTPVMDWLDPLAPRGFWTIAGPLALCVGCGLAALAVVIGGGTFLWSLWKRRPLPVAAWSFLLGLADLSAFLAGAYMILVRFSTEA